MYVIGTAGHVDHGKSTLVKTLTGIDPDRWEEERRREMTIDLGFAWLILPSGRSVSIVDVPGHERFIKNMLAGVGGIDAALLVIAADEAMMPQTDEHLAILDLLDVQHALVVLTKTDLVDAEWLELVRQDVWERVQPTTLAAAPIVAVSARNGAGLDELLVQLDLMLDTTPARGQDAGKPRLPIDRAFTIGGFGTIVTGTLIDGALRIGDEIEVAPKGLRGRVRGLQSHNAKLEAALPGTRVAVNLAGIAHHQVARGDVLMLPGALVPTDMIDVQVRLAADARPLEQNAPLELFIGAAETLCRATLLDREQLLAGEIGWLQLRLEHQIAVARGDRYILRQPSPGRTIGGGRVLDAHPRRHRRFRPEVVAGLEALARGTPADLLRPLLADGLPHEWAALLRQSGLSDTHGREGLAALLANGEALVIGRRGFPADGQATAGEAGAIDDRDTDDASQIISSSGWHVLAEKVATTLQGYHRRYHLRSTMPREELRSRLKLNAAGFEAVVAVLAGSGIIVSESTGVRLSEHRPQPDQAQQRAVERVLEAMAAAPYNPPPVDLDIELVTWLVEQGKVVRVADDVLFQRATYDELLAWVRDHIRATGSVTVAEFRDRFGTSRKYALALLEYLDERKITRREGEGRGLASGQ